jgi:hypothetical protein
MGTRHQRPYKAGRAAVSGATVHFSTVLMPGPGSGHRMERIDTPGPLNVRANKKLEGAGKSSRPSAATPIFRKTALVFISAPKLCESSHGAERD